MRAPRGLANIAVARRVLWSGAMRIALLIPLICTLAACGVDPDMTADTTDPVLSAPYPNVPPVSFSIATAIPRVSIVRGHVAGFFVETTASDVGTCITVTTSVTGLPAGATLYFSDGLNHAVSGSYTLCHGGQTGLEVDIDTSVGMPAGTYPMTITEAGGRTARSLSVWLTVRPPGLTATVWPPGANLAGGQTASASFVVATDAAGLDPIKSTTVDLFAYNLPPGVTATFSPATITPGDRSTVTFTAPSGVSVSTADVTIEAVDGSLRASAAFPLGPQTQLVTDGGFESGGAWSTAGGFSVFTWSGSPYQLFSGFGTHEVGGVGTGSVGQRITIPSSAASATLSFWMVGSTPPGSRVTVSVIDMATRETTRLANYDQLWIPYDPISYSAPRLSRYDLDVSQFCGHTIGLLFAISTDPNAEAGVVTIDEVSLVARY